MDGVGLLTIGQACIRPSLDCFLWQYTRREALVTVISDDVHYRCGSLAFGGP